MSERTLKDVAEHFERLKWTYSIEGTTLLTGIRCSVPFYWQMLPIHITISANWVHLRGVVQLRVPPDRVLMMSEYLSVLNARCHSVRFFLQGDAVFSQADVPVAVFSFEQIFLALQGICLYSSWYGPEIAALATNRSLGDLYLRVRNSIPAANARAESADLEEPVFAFDVSVNRLTR